MVRAYDAFLAALAGIAAAALAILAVVIAYEVTLRTIGLRPPVWPVALAEYTMLYATALGTPYLLHRSEHVIVTSLIVMLGPTARRRLERFVCALGMVVSLIIAYFSIIVTWNAQGLEIRSFEMPKWLVYIPLPVGFLLLAIEFARKLVRGGLFVGDELEYLDKKAS